MRSSFSLLLVLLLMFGAASAAELFGTVDAVEGAASLTGENGANTAIAIGSKIYVGQSIITGMDGEVHVVTADSGLIALRPNSSFRVNRYQAKGEASDEISFSLFKGALRSITGWIAKRNPSAYKLNTASATIGIRGTDHETFIIETANAAEQPGTYNTVYEGLTVVQTAHGNTEVRPGESAFAARNAGQAPTLLARRPEFMEHRSLRMEQRIEQRKESLSTEIHQRLQARSNARDDAPDSAERSERATQRLQERRMQHRPQ
jgi:hypothetical protein